MAAERTANDRPTLSVVIPVYNERVFLKELLRRVLATEIDKEIILVDDCSTDGTRDQLRELAADPAPWEALGKAPASIRVLFHEQNQGKGGALRTGIRQARGAITLIQDADLEYNPQDYPRLLAPILSGNADVVYGSRFRGDVVRVHYFWHALGNQALTLLSNMFTNLCLTDMETCYKVFKTEIVQGLPIRCNRFGFEPEITAKVAKLGCRIYEVPISYSGRTYEEGKKITWWDGVKALLTIVRFSIVDDLYDESAGPAPVRTLLGAGRYNHWLFQQCQPFIGRRVLELGANVGDITKYLMDRDRIVCADSDPTFLRELRRKFSQQSNARVVEYRLEQPQEIVRLVQEEAIDTVLTVNLLPSAEDDARLVAAVHDALPRAGRAVFVVPAHRNLFSRLDELLRYRRRYDRAEIVALFERAGFTIVHVGYLNWLGAIGWAVNGRLLRARRLPTRQIRWFDRLLFFVRLERWLPFPFGLSLLIVGRKT